VATRLLEFDSHSTDEDAARDEARAKLGGQAPNGHLRAVTSGPGPGFASGGPMTHWVFEVTT
jgi:hypothetical protein